MVKHNYPLANTHYYKRKKWSIYVKTWFNQQARKHRRQIRRATKAKLISPMPLDKLRPIVRCTTLKYKDRMRQGKGFTLEEIRLAGLTPGMARSIGIAVDHRRVDTNKETLDSNVSRIKVYLSKLILFPRSKSENEGNKKRIVPNSSADLLQSPSAKHGITSDEFNHLFPVPQLKKKEKPMNITEELKKQKLFPLLRKERTALKYAGIRKKRADEAKEKQDKKE